MLHIHFGAGRLGLGLIVPFFATAGTTSFILNRAVSGTNPTGTTALLPQRRNDLLRDNTSKAYVVQQPANQGGRRELINYDAFFEYGTGGEDIGSIVRRILEKSTQPNDGVVVTASLISASNYRPVLEALELLAQSKEDGALGPIFLVTCENTLSAPEIFEDRDLASVISDKMRGHVTPVPALVDRVCIGLEESKEEDREGPHPVVMVTTEEYGFLKLELSPATEDLARRFRGAGWSSPATSRLRRGSRAGSSTAATGSWHWPPSRKATATQSCG